jgi:hypothetical protein
MLSLPQAGVNFRHVQGTETRGTETRGLRRHGVTETRGPETRGQVLSFAIRCLFNKADSGVTHEA